MDIYIYGFSVGSDSKESACNAGDPCLIPDLGRSPYTHYFHILFHCSLSQGVEDSSLCCAEEPRLPVLCISPHLPTPISQSFSPACLPAGNQMSVLCLWVCCFSVERYICVAFRFHVQMISYDICLPFPDLLHLVWSSLGPSMLLQMALCHFFIWVSCIPLYIYSTFSWWNDIKLYALLIG